MQEKHVAQMGLAKSDQREGKDQEWGKDCRREPQHVSGMVSVDAE